jgi:Asp-tRNA(Asn)/Glu-tRNA(Gln) amidotransferase C subunit
MDPQPHTISDEVIAAACQIASLELTEERIAELAPNLHIFFAAFAALDALDLLEVEPVVTFSPEWR